MTIQWPDEGKPPGRRVRQHWLTMPGAPMVIDPGTLPNGRRRRDLLVLLGFLAVLIILFALLWFLGPLPRVFPLMCDSGCPSVARAV
jgi:hypothetical protein